MPPLSIPAMFFETAGRRRGQTRCLVKTDGAFVPTSWDQCLTNVEEIASGLLGLGRAREDRLAILSSTRPEWVEADLAALAVGCVTIPIYPSSLAEECAYILVDSGARTVIVENADQAEKIRAAVGAGVEIDGNLHEVKLDHLIVIEGEAEGCLRLDALKADGRGPLSDRRREIESRTSEIHPEQLATIVYTSGTTGRPKGVMQSHGNHLAAIEAVRQLDIVREGELDFLFLPLAHSFGRMMEFLGLSSGSVTVFAEKIETISDDVALSRPHFMPSVPRIFEKIYSRVLQAMDEATPARRRIFNWALEVGKRRSEHVNRGTAVPVILRLSDRLAHRLVFKKIHDLMGGRMRYLISGGAPLSPEINQFFHAVGLPVLEGYGLTETTPILTCNKPGHTRVGTVGTAVPGVTLQLAGDGEILAKGPNIAYGYYQRPEDTAEAWDSEGWFHTGDIGVIEDGFLRITDRKKELIKTAGGKYVAPQKIENLLKARPMISQAAVIGDRLKFCVALLTLDPDAAAEWSAKAHGQAKDLAFLAEDRRMVAKLQTEVDVVNSRLASFETIKYFRILPRDFSVESGELTPSLKLKRKVITERYADIIGSLAAS